MLVDKALFSITVAKNFKTSEAQGITQTVIAIIYIAVSC